MDSREEAILKTLLYSNLFDYPLQEEEIYNFLIAKKMDRKEFSTILKSGKIPIDFSEGSFFLKGDRKLVRKRQAREIISLEKLKKAGKIIRKLSLIPTIKLIGISGTLAMKNCEKNNDIDIFVIAESGLTWTTRFLTAGLLSILGVYRNKSSKQYQDKICLNLVLSEDRMLFDKEDLFTAHEIIQLLPVFERGGIYKKFLSTNGWVKKFLPNFQIKHKPVFKKQQNHFDRLFISICKILFLEKILKTLQLFYMRKAITKERLENGFIGLHPFDYKSHVLKKYNAEISKFGLT
jgi:hypothetical protein